MKLKDYYKQQKQKKEQRWTGVSKYRAKNKAGSKGIHARNGQIEGVWIEALFSTPNWTKYAHK